MQDFSTKVAQLREKYLNYSAARTLQGTFGEQGHKGEPYPKLFAGAKTLLKSNLTVQVSDAPPSLSETIRKTIAQQAR